MKYWLTTYALLVAALLLLAHEWSLFPGEKLHLTLLDVGQGDAILITTPGKQRILVDGGPDLSVLERVGDELPFLLRRIDLLILTHSDSDHVTGLPSLLRRYSVEHVLMTGVDASSSRYRDFLSAISETGTQVIIAEAGNDLDLGEGVFLDVLWPEESLFGQQMKDPNNASIVAKLVWKDHEILLTGDIEEDVEEALLRNGTDVSADILKVAHHGSRTSSSTGFLLAASPELALISAGAENRFGHPHEDVLSRHEALQIPVRRTDKEGRIEIVLE